jgi:hypothetical protein
MAHNAQFEAPGAVRPQVGCARCGDARGEAIGNACSNCIEGDHWRTSASRPIPSPPRAHPESLRATLGAVSA